MLKSFKWASLLLANVAMAPIDGLLALLLTGTHFSVSSGVGFLALFGVSVQTGVIMVEYINQRRARGHSIEEAAVEGETLRLRVFRMFALSVQASAFSRVQDLSALPGGSRRASCMVVKSPPSH